VEPEPPRFLFVDVNQRCNLKCRHCEYWKRGVVDGPDSLSIARRHEILNEFSALSPHGTVVVCGGESMLDPDEYFAVSATCRSLGLRCFSVINGTRVATAEAAARMVREGPSEVTVSLNSHRADVHDWTRGAQGSFHSAVRALRLLLEARSSQPVPRVYAMAVVAEFNYRELDALYHFVLRDIGADKLKLNMLQPTFGPRTWWFRDRFFAEQLVRDADALVEVIGACDTKYELQINPVWLRQVAMYHRSVRGNGFLGLGWRGPRGTAEHICNSYERNIMVDVRGNAGLCFNPAFPSTPLRRPGDLTAFWANSGPLRARMRRCNRYCGISHSVRREAATCPTDPARLPGDAGTP
jgi:MoaA/NifB/PqqE/SkfB family radical SAM enzyme